MGAGRKRLCSPKLAKELYNHIVGGLSYKDACACAGISESSFYFWISRGEKETERIQNGKDPQEYERVYAEFSDVIKKAVPERKKKLVKTILDAGDKSWQAVAWYLERVHSDEFALNRNTHQNKDTEIAVVDVDVDKL